MTKVIDINRIIELLPHRHPFLLVDRVLDYVEFDYLTAIKAVTMNEPFFVGHFPGNPIMPGVLILEALAQAGALLSNLSLNPQSGHEFLYFFASIDNAKFKHVVTPGDVLRLELKSLTRKSGFWRMHAKAFVEDKLACSADLMSAVKEIKRDK